MSKFYRLEIKVFISWGDIPLTITFKMLCKKKNYSYYLLIAALFMSCDLTGNVVSEKGLLHEISQGNT